MSRRHSREFKLGIVRQIAGGEMSKAQACREHNLSPSMLDRWCDQYRAKGEDAFPRSEAGAPDAQGRIRALENSLGRAHLEIEFLKEALSKKG
jgi:transposase-like protein